MKVGDTVYWLNPRDLSIHRGQLHRIEGNVALVEETHLGMACERTRISMADLCATIDECIQRMNMEAARRMLQPPPGSNPPSGGQQS